MKTISTTGEVDPLAEAVHRLQSLIEDARQRGLADADAAALATATADARPSVRTVGIARIDREGLVFFADSGSGKGRQLEANPWASLCFHWPGLKQQVVVEGHVSMLADAEADSLWAKLPREYGLGHWAATESPDGADPASLRERAREVGRRFTAERVPRAPGWCGYRLAPRRFDFWQSDWRRLQLHREYRRDEDGTWRHDNRSP